MWKMFRISLLQAGDLDPEKVSKFDRYICYFTPLAVMAEQIYEKLALKGRTKTLEEENLWSKPTLAHSTKICCLTNVIPVLSLQEGIVFLIGPKYLCRFHSLNCVHISCSHP
jgi:hypothetical protein